MSKTISYIMIKIENPTIWFAYLKILKLRKVGAGFFFFLQYKANLKRLGPEFTYIYDLLQKFKTSSFSIGRYISNTLLLSM